MGTVVIVGVVVLVALVGAVVAIVLLGSRRKRAAVEPAVLPPDPSRSTIAPAAPMTGLESALDRVTDRSGRTLRDKLAEESAVVDDLRVPDDTGPLLRRALDRVEQPGDADPAAPPASPGS